MSFSLISCLGFCRDTPSISSSNASARKSKAEQGRAGQGRALLIVNLKVPPWLHVNQYVVQNQGRTHGRHHCKPIFQRKAIIIAPPARISVAWVRGPESDVSMYRCTNGKSAPRVPQPLLQSRFRSAFGGRCSHVIYKQRIRRVEPIIRPIIRLCPW